jgi:hypothetical protein
LLRRGVLVDREEATSALGAWCGDVNDAPEGRWVSLRVAP